MVREAKRAKDIRMWWLPKGHARGGTVRGDRLKRYLYREWNIKNTRAHFKITCTRTSLFMSGLFIYICILKDNLLRIIAFAYFHG